MRCIWSTDASSGARTCRPADAEDYITPADRNGDEWVCIKQYKPNQGRDKHYGAPGYVVSLLSDENAAGRL
ncbi:hypothetical protein ACFFGH_31505 [Lysobacter korlensis]|uniref:Uncharacterized protein n=1 Tax=Lysobacter korlensis TaxID=553636 RepID=A0ABV6RZH3_9GAMM